MPGTLAALPLAATLPAARSAAFFASLASNHIAIAKIPSTPTRMPSITDTTATRANRSDSPRGIGPLVVAGYRTCVRAAPFEVCGRCGERVGEAIGNLLFTSLSQG